MIRSDQILKTVSMIQKEHLDLRTITMGINLLDCRCGNVSKTCVAVERKTLDDFVSTVIHSRERFRAELQKLAAYRAACVVVETGITDILQRRYRGEAHPNAVLGNALSIILDYRIPVFFCSNRQAACHFVQAYLLAVHARWST